MGRANGATLVLVHGAGAGAWCWELVARELDDLGITHRAIDLPSVGAASAPDAGLQGDAAAVRKLLDNLTSPVVLVGNSYGGFVISAAAVHHQAVARLVYIAAFMPVRDVPVMDQLVTTDAFGAAIRYSEDGLGGLDPEQAVPVAFHQSESEVARTAASRLQGMRLSDFDAALPAVAWETIPSTYVVCTDDRAIPPEHQRRCANERATVTIEMPYDHVPLLSHPREIAEILADIATEVTTASHDR